MEEEWAGLLSAAGVCVFVCEVYLFLKKKVSQHLIQKRNIVETVVKLHRL